jgi:predicted nucleic acid-binding protein
MILVDANVLAYLLIESNPREMAQRLYAKDQEWHSEGFILVELTNVLTTNLRHGSLSMPICIETLAEADKVIGSNLHTIPHVEVLRTAHEFRISAYDARYIALAREFGTPLITEDAKLRRAVPRLTISLKDALEQ